MEHILAYSGGKDSTATLFRLIEMGIIPIVTFQDTGNESLITYDYVDYIDDIFYKLTGTRIIKLRGEYNFLSLAIHKKRFPSIKARFCTQWLKIVPFLRWLEDQEFSENCTVVTGIRADESKARSGRKEHEPDSTYGRPLWNPIIDWSVEDVFSLHDKHGVDKNPLYKLGFGRVGCFPCVNCGRTELCLISRHFPDRIKEIHEWEKKVAEERNKSPKFKDKREFQSYFAPRRKNAATGQPIIWDINQHVAWAEETISGQESFNFVEEKTYCAYANLGICE